jgi:hypothetical protein
MPAAKLNAPTAGRLRPRLKLVPAGKKAVLLRFLNGSEYQVHRDGTMTPIKK